MIRREHAGLTGEPATIERKPADCFRRVFIHRNKEPTMQEEKNKQVIRQFTRIFKNEHNVDGVAQLFDTGFVHHFRAPVASGFEGLRQVGLMMNGAFPDVVVTEEDLIACGDKVVERSSAVATNKGAMMGAPPTSKKVKWSEIHIYRLRDGKIAEHWAEVSMMELLQQIGALPQLS
jgi:predicted ester cyclase